MKRNSLSHRKRFRAIYHRDDATLVNLHGIIPAHWDIVYLSRIRFEDDKLTITFVPVKIEAEEEIK